MQKIFLNKYLLVVLLLMGGVGLRTQAQPSQLPSLLSDFTNCYPAPALTRPSAGANRNYGYNPYGYDVTARGNLRVLIVYAGFTNDINLMSPNYSNSDWPQTDATHPVAGTTFPANANDIFYNNPGPTSFSASATDKTLSNFYYQMSQFSSSPFRLSAAVYPKRINVTADSATSAAKGFLTYSEQVMQVIKNDPARLDFSQVDNRQGAPSFQTDTSVPGSDNVVDYTIIVWRNPGVPYRQRVRPNYGEGSYASVPFATNLPSTNGHYYQVHKGFTQTGGLGGMDVPLFVHEFAHMLYSAPHSLLAGKVVGQYFTATEGPGMMSHIRTYFAANAWERWFNGWAEIQASGVSADIQGPGSFGRFGGIYTLRDYITTGDVARIKLPNSNQYLWLENHQGQSVFDNRFNFIYDGQTPAQLLPAAPGG